MFERESYLEHDGESVPVRLEHIGDNVILSCDIGERTVVVRGATLYMRELLADIANKIAATDGADQ